jgi:DNA primase
MDNRLFEQIKNRLPITEVLSTYITLEPSGSQYKARCPFHNEKTASFSVSPERGLYYCFGCGAKGDIFTFVEQFEGVDKKGALKILAERAGIPMTASNAAGAEPTDNLYDALETAAKKYQAVLESNTEARAYLKQRGVTEQTMAEFRLGYAPSEWRTIASSLDQNSTAFYERAGLIKKTDPTTANAKVGEERQRYYDRFRGRIMFPLSDSSGRIVAFSGRIFPETQNDTQEGPKYLNSPETEIFHKSRILFGFDKAKGAIKKHNFAILVEGQMDLILSHQAGFKNTVATSGTAVSETVIGDTSAQLSVIARLTPNIFLAFDGDSAGQKALERAALVTLSLGMNPKVVALPEGMDPADYIAKQGSDDWKELLKNAEHFIPHILHTIQKSVTSAHQLKESIRTRLFPFLMRVQSAIERNVYLNTIAAESSLGIKEVNDDFISFLKTNEPSFAETSAGEAFKQTITAVPINPMERFMVIELLFPEAAAEHKAMLAGYRFHDATIVFPTFEGGQRERAIAIVEREFSTLNEEQQQEIIKELTHVIIAQFLEQLRFEYAMKMNEAKQQKNEAAELEYLALLQKLHQSRQGI